MSANVREMDWAGGRGGLKNDEIGMEIVFN